MTKIIYLLVCLICIRATAFAQEILTNQNIIALDQAKASRNLIIEKINSSRCQFDMSTTGLLGLKSVNIPESVIEAMLAVTRPSDVLRNEDVIRLSQGGLGRKLVTQKIQAGPTQFNVTSDGVIQLKTAKVPEPIIKIMMTGTSASAPSTPTKAATKPSTKVSQGTRPPVETVRPTASTTQTKESASDCDTWYDKFTKKNVKTSRVTLRGWKPGAVALNTLVGRGSANAFGIEDMEVNLIFRRDGNDLTLVLYASKPGIHTLLVSSDKPLMFLMQDESVMEFLPAEDSESDFSGSGYSMESEMLMYYRLTAEQARTLTQKTIKEYRLNFYNRKSAQDKVNESRAVQLRSAAQCVLNG